MAELSRGKKAKRSVRSIWRTLIIQQEQPSVTLCSIERSQGQYVMRERERGERNYSAEHKCQHKYVIITD